MSNPAERTAVELTQWRSQGNYCHHCGKGEWYVAPGGFEIHKRMGRWIATWKQHEIARDPALSNVMMELCK